MTKEEFSVITNGTNLFCGLTLEQLLEENQDDV